MSTLPDYIDSKKMTTQTEILSWEKGTDGKPASPITKKKTRPISFEDYTRGGNPHLYILIRDEFSARTSREQPKSKDPLVLAHWKNFQNLSNQQKPAQQPPVSRTSEVRKYKYDAEKGMTYHVLPTGKLSLTLPNS